MNTFQNRAEGGKKLAQKLTRYANKPNVLVFALPRGGLPVAYEISNALNAPLDIFIVRKLGVPWQPELAFGAIAIGGQPVFNEEVVKLTQLTPEAISAVVDSEQEELVRRDREYRGGKKAPDVKGMIVILVDDGLATGASMRAAVLTLKSMHPAKIIVAVPVSPADTYQEFKSIADEVVCVDTPEPFYAVGQWYIEFPQLTDEEVKEYLKKSK